MTAKILLGAIADDCIGATEFANILVRGGIHTVLAIGVPEANTELPPCDAIVVALKSRAIDATGAVAQPHVALGWLSEPARCARSSSTCVPRSTRPMRAGQLADALLDALAGAIETLIETFCLAIGSGNR